MHRLFILSSFLASSTFSFLADVVMQVFLCFFVRCRASLGPRLPSRALFGHTETTQTSQCHTTLRTVLYRRVCLQQIVRTAQNNSKSSLWKLLIFIRPRHVVAAFARWYRVHTLGEADVAARGEASGTLPIGNDGNANKVGVEGGVMDVAAGEVMATRAIDAGGDPCKRRGELPTSREDVAADEASIEGGERALMA